MRIQHNNCKIHHPKRGVIIQYAISFNRMFKVAAVALPTMALSLWSLSFKGLNTLQRKEMVSGLPTDKIIISV